MRNAKKDFWEGTASSFDCLSKGQNFSRGGIYDRPNFLCDCTERGFRIYDLGVASGCEKFLQNVAVEIHRFGLNFTMKWFADIIRAHPTPLRNISNEKKPLKWNTKRPWNISTWNMENLLDSELLRVCTIVAVNSDCGKLSRVFQIMTSIGSLKRCEPESKIHEVLNYN